MACVCKDVLQDIIIIHLLDNVDLALLINALAAIIMFLLQPQLIVHIASLDTYSMLILKEYNSALLNPTTLVHHLISFFQLLNSVNLVYPAA